MTLVLLRYAVARRIVHLGLWLMPAGAYRSELLEALWRLNAKVRATVAVARALGLDDPVKKAP